VGASRGLGYLMVQANARLRLDRVFAAILLLTLLGLGLFWFLGLLERLLLPRRYNLGL
jgi:putative hydroxymethylpyrimidine transport system permease protein